MKKKLIGLIIIAGIMLSCLPVLAEGRDCWYYAQNGQHDFEQTNFYYPTCEKDGYYVLECRQCGLNRKEVTMEASGHSYGSWKIVKEATEASKGLQERSCSTCGAKSTREYYPDGALYRGCSDADGVKQLQQLLSDCGYLNDSIDGKFGKNTEAAVKAFQEAAGLQADGVAWPQTIRVLTAEWEAPASPGIPAGNSGFTAPFCYSWENDDGSTTSVYCEKHAEMYAAQLNLLADGTADSILYSYGTWQREILDLYDAWIELLPEASRDGVAANRALCLSMMEAQRSAMLLSYEACATGIGIVDAEYGMQLWMRTHAAWLCQMCNTLSEPQ